MKAVVSSDLVRFVYVVCAMAAVCTPSGGLLLARYSLPLAYQYSSLIWFLWIWGNLGSVIWSALYFRSEPVFARLALAAVALSLITAAFLPRM